MELSAPHLPQMEVSALHPLVQMSAVKDKCSGWTNWTWMFEYDTRVKVSVC